jgi:pimeloyl-ACP methyl ester carboxylesterase
MATDVCFLHGFNEDSAQWDRVLAAVGDAVASCTIDLPGHGGSRIATPVPYSPALVVDMVRQALNDAARAPRVCVAHSAAASVAIELVQQGCGIEGLVLISPSIEGYPFEGDFGFRLRLLRQAAAATDANTRFVRQWQLVHGVIAGMAADGSAVGLGELFRAVGGSITFPPTTRFPWHHLDGLECDVTVLVAADDFPVYRQHHVALQARRPSWRWVLVDSGGHDLPRTRPAEVAEAVMAAAQASRSVRPCSFRNST